MAIPHKADALPSKRHFAMEFLLEDHRALWMVALLAVVFFSVTNLPWQLDEYSQDRQALASFDMIREGHWLYQQAPRDRDATKPPVIPWISAGIYEVTRSWDVAWRLPSFAAAAALACLVLRAARERFGRSAGLLGFSAFALNMVSPRLATLVRTDMPLALVVALVGLQIWKKIETEEPWRRRDRWLMFALLTIGALIKGPIIYVFLLPGIALFQWRWRKETAANAWCGCWPWLASCAVFLVWVIGGLITQPGFFDQVIMHEFLGRFSTTEQRSHPPYYYIGHLLQKFAPWSELLIILAVLNLRSKGESIRSAIASIRPDVFWLVCWSLSGLIIMSLVPSKRLDRIYPLIPPFCLLVAAQVGRAFPNGSLRKQINRWGALALAASLLLTSQYAITKVFYGYRDHRDAFVTFGREVRRQAAAQHWRYEVVTTHDGGMLLYLEKTHFIQPDQAAAGWNGGQIDALVIRQADAATLLTRLSDAKISSLRSRQRKDDRSNGYLLVVRANSGL